jgi:hypothetical protein
LRLPEKRGIVKGGLGVEPGLWVLGKEGNWGEEEKFGGNMIDEKGGT